MKVKLNIKSFLKKFQSEYNWLYDNAGNYVAGYSEALDEYDRMAKTNKSFLNLVRDFCKYRGDYLSSDREIVAFMFALDSMTN